ncbi:MAG: LCP family protein [Clostridia bacterium]|nr:LCP family protein [Clostridia bacterium]
MDQRNNNTDSEKTKIFDLESAAHGSAESAPAEAESVAGETLPVRRVAGRERPRYLLIVGIMLLLLIASVAVCGVLYKKYYRPTVNTDVPFVPVTPVDTTPTSSGPEETRPSETAPLPENTYVRNKNVVNFLVLGTDRYAMNTDVIMVVNFNSETKQINIVQIMRDTYVRYDGIKDRINTVYGHFYNKTGSSEKAMQEVEKVFEQAFSIQIDYYALVDLVVFREVVDAVGGVYVNVPFDYDYEDPWQDLYIHLRAGYQLLDGNKAEQFVRYRAGYALADKGRTDAQKMFFSALLSRVKEKFKTSVSSAVNVATSVLRNMDTNLTGAEMGYYVPLMIGVDLNALKMATVYGEGLYVDAKAMVGVNREVSREIVNRMLNVYNLDITDELFDAGRMLVDSANETMLEIYYRTGMVPDIVSGDKTDDIYIIPN